jgi:hypothetical protein
VLQLRARNANEMQTIMDININPEIDPPGAIGFCEYCNLPIYDSAIINHCLFRCEKYDPKITFMRMKNVTDKTAKA